MDSTPLTEGEYEQLALLISEKTGHTLIDPRHALDHVLEFTKDLSAEQQDWLDRYAAHFGFQFRILFGISSEAQKAQAYALRDQSSSAIVVSIALIVKIQSYFSLLLCNPSFFSDIGDISSEIWPRKQENGVLNIRPADPARRWISGMLMRIAFRFIVAHELTHIQQGHLLLTQITNGTNRLGEIPSLNDSGDAFARQALEIAADQSALRILVSDTSIWTYQNDAVPPENHDVSALIDRLWFYSLFTTFRILDNGRKHPPITEATHPRPIFRISNVYRFLDSRLRENHNEPERETLAMRFASVISEARIAFAALGVPEVDRESLIESASLSFPDYADNLNHEWAKLLTDLKGLSVQSGELPETLIKIPGNEIDLEKLRRHLNVQ